MTNQDTPAVVPATNSQLARLLGMSTSGISRLRSGGRLPSVALMLRIEGKLGWSVAEQAIARERGTYGVEFEAAVTRAIASAS